MSSPRERLLCRLGVVVLALILATSVSAQDHSLQNPALDPPQGTLRLDNGRWWDGERFAPATFFVVDGALRESYDGETDATIDLDGGFVVPPFADAHRHQFAEGADVEAQRLAALRQGVFYVKNPHDVAAFAAHAAPQVNRPASVDVAYSHAGLTSSGGHPVQIFEAMAAAGGLPGIEGLAGQAYFTIDTAADLVAQWDLVLAARPDFLKVYLHHSEEHAKRRDDPDFFGRRGLDPALVPAIVARARAAGLRVSAHVETAADFRNALGARVDEINHLPLERLSEVDAEDAARRGVVVVTTTLSHRPSGHGPDVEEIHRHNLTLLARSGARLAIGTDNNDVTPLDEAMNVARLASLTPQVLLRMWTEATPQAIFPERKIGRLEAGWEASFLVLDGNPLEDVSHLRDIRLRVKEGRVLELPEEPRVRPVESSPFQV